MSDPSQANGRRILIIDDSPSNLDILCRIFESAGHEVLVSTDGQSGCAIAERVTPDLILLDVLMPGRNGFETCQYLKQSFSTRGIPVIFISAKDDKTNLLEGFRVGGVDYISKPFHHDEVMARVQAHLTIGSLHRELAKKNIELGREIERFQRADRELKELNSDLEKRIAERTARLEVLNRKLENDIARRKKAEAALRQIPWKIIEAQEAERKRVAQELHDGVTQLLLSAKYRLNWLLQEHPNRTATEIEVAGSIRKLLETATDEVRGISKNLRPPELDDLGLWAATRSMCNAVAKWSGLEIDLQHAAMPKRLPAGIELNLYRIIQEALSNVQKHARATRVTIRFRQSDSALELTISDNGSGFETGSSSGGRNPGGFGLFSMQERARSLNGTIEIGSSAGHGVQIVVRIPPPKLADAGKLNEKKTSPKNQIDARGRPSGRAAGN